MIKYMFFFCIHLQQLLSIRTIVNILFSFFIVSIFFFGYYYEMLCVI